MSVSNVMINGLNDTISIIRGGKSDETIAQGLRYSFHQTVVVEWDRGDGS